MIDRVKCFGEVYKDIIDFFLFFCNVFLYYRLQNKNIVNCGIFMMKFCLFFGNMIYGFRL